MNTRWKIIAAFVIGTLITGSALWAADNTLLPISGGTETFANDDIGGVKYPRSKVTWGPDGTANDTDVASGKSMPVQIRSATGLIPLGEPTDAKSTATDGTSASAISIWKQISASIQSLASGLAQGSTTSGQTGSLVLCATTTAITGGSNATSNAINCTPAGALRNDLSTIAGTAVVNGGTAGITGVGGSTATNVALTDNPLNTGGQAVSSENAAVTTGRKVQFVADLTGKQIVMPYANPENFLNPVPTAAITDTTSTQVMAAIASFRNYVTYCKVTNSHASVGSFVQILDGSTVVDSGYVAPAGGGFVTKYDPPIRGTANTALNCQATTTGANFKCSCGGFKGV